MEGEPAVALRSYRMSLVSLLLGKRGKSGFGYGSTAEEVTEGVDLRGKNVLLTGINSGIGAESARVLALRGARILGAARTKEKASEALAPLTDAVPLACELSEPASVRACVEEVRALGVELDVILCNAGIMMLPKREVAYGQEKQFLTNHLGHFLLVTGLLDRLRADARVVMVSSDAHRWASRIRVDDIAFERGYSPPEAYGQSKLANILFARGLARRFEGTARTANACHPGVIATNLTRHMNPVVRVMMPIASFVAMKSIPQGAATQCFLAAHPSVASTTGKYFSDCNETTPSRAAREDAVVDELWRLSASFADQH